MEVGDDEVACVGRRLLARPSLADVLRAEDCDLYVLPAADAGDGMLDVRDDDLEVADA